MPIKFGTDGWRAVIAEDFTFENVKLVAQAISDYFNSLNSENKIVIVGYDLRFLSEKYASIVAEILSANNFNVILSKTAIPTPALSFNVVDKKALFGVMITSSHNPYYYNGIKIKTGDGASATVKETIGIESFLGKNSINQFKKEVMIEDLTPKYLKYVSKFADMNIINKSKIKVVFEPMYGSAQGCLKALLNKSSIRLSTVHDKRDVLFGGLKPEPLDFLMGDLKRKIKEEKAHIGLVTDGDGDRFAIVDDLGRFFSSQHIMVLLMDYMLEIKKMRGGVVITTATTSAAEVIAKKYGLKIYYTPIGFKYIADLMLKQDILIGAEESGGIGIKGYLPERDGVLLSLMLIEMLSRTKKKPSVLLKQLEKKYGKFVYDRKDVSYPAEKKDVILKKINDYNPLKILNKRVVNISRNDGVKFTMEDMSWLVLRPSGTEPILRIYAEANSRDDVSKYLKFGESLIR